MGCNFPLGALDDPSAPYNRVNRPVQFDVMVTFSMTKSTMVSDTRAIDDGYHDVDSSSCNFEEDFEEQQLTPLDLLGEYATRLENELESFDESKNPRKAKSLRYRISCCKGWMLDFLEVNKQ